MNVLRPLEEKTKRWGWLRRGFFSFYFAQLFSFWAEIKISRMEREESLSSFGGGETKSRLNYRVTLSRKEKEREREEKAMFGQSRSVGKKSKKKTSIDNRFSGSRIPGRRLLILIPNWKLLFFFFSFRVSHPRNRKNAPNASSTFYFIFCPIRNVCGLLGGRSMSQPMFHTLPVLASGFFFLSFALREPEKLLPVFALGRPGHTFFSSSTCGSLSDLLLTVSFFSLLSKMDTQCAITKRQSLVGRLFLSFPWEKGNTHGYSHLLGIMLTVRCLFGFFFPGLSTYHLDILGHPEQFDIVTQIKIRSEKLRVFTLRG